MFKVRNRVSPKVSRRLLMAALALALLAAPAPMFAQDFSPLTPDPAQVPQPAGGGVNWGGVGWGALSVFANIPYVPAKLLYALTGSLVGAGAWAMTAGNTQVANTVWRSSLGGDYVLTPSMLQGKDPISFAGPTSTAPAAVTVKSAPAIASNSPLGATVASSGPSPAVPAAPDQGTGPVGSRADRSIE